ncbi:MAG: hypothetical protein AAGK21_05680 [Bacteroidota bacterium]
MTRALALTVLALAATSADAQTDLVSTGADSAREEATVHTFLVFEGTVYLDGRPLPDAVPDGLNLSGMMTAPIEFSGDLRPVLEVDGQVFVLEQERLVPIEESSQAGQDVYILGPTSPTPAAISPERTRPIVEAAYMRDIADTDRMLYENLQREAILEAEVSSLADRYRQLAPGPTRSQLYDDLRQRISNLLGLKHEIRAQEIALAEDRLDAARAGLDRRRSLHDAIVDTRLQELVGER